LGRVLSTSNKRKGYTQPTGGRRGKRAVRRMFAWKKEKRTLGNLLQLQQHIKNQGETTRLIHLNSRVFTRKRERRERGAREEGS